MNKPQAGTNFIEGQKFVCRRSNKSRAFSFPPKIGDKNAAEFCFFYSAPPIATTRSQWLLNYRDILVFRSFDDNL
jgi:hypothetical protein